MDNISYMNIFLPQSYMMTMTRDQASLMLTLRTLTLRGIRTDLGTMYLDKECPVPGCQDQDSIPHLLACQALQVSEPAGASVVQYGDVFPSSPEKQNLAIARFSQLVRNRTELLEQN